MTDRRRAIVAAIVSIALTGIASCGGGDGGTHSQPPSPFPIAVDLGPDVGVSAAWGSDRYLVAYSDRTTGAGSNTAGLRLTQDGEVIDAAPLLLSDFGGDPFLAPGADYSPGGIAFAEGAFGVFLFGEGTIAGDSRQVVGFVSVPEDGIPVLPATAIDEQPSGSMPHTSLRSPITATSNSRRFLAVYLRILAVNPSVSLNQVFGQILTLSQDGIIAQPVGPLSGVVPPVGGAVTSGSRPGVAINPAVTLVAWVETSAAENSPADVSTYVTGVFLTPQQAIVIRLSDTESGSQNVAVASDGMDFLVVWTATAAGDPVTLGELRALRVASTGSVDPAGSFLIDGGDRAKALGSVAFANGSYLVTWIEDGALRGARVNTHGAAAEVFTIDQGPVANVALATDGDRFLAVFDRSSGPSSSDLLGIFVSP